MKCLVSAMYQLTLNPRWAGTESTMSDKTAKVPAHDTVPCCALAVVELHAS